MAWARWQRLDKSFRGIRVFLGGNLYLNCSIFVHAADLFDVADISLRPTLGKQLLDIIEISKRMTVYRYIIIIGRLCVIKIVVSKIL